MKPTSARAVASLLNRGKPAQLCAGNNLYLKITGVNAGSWFYRFSRQGKTTRLGLGSARIVSLSEARMKAAQYKSILDNGILPFTDQFNQAYQDLRPNATFDEVAASYIKSQKSGWKSKKHAQQWVNTIKTYASPTIGNLTPDQITTAHLVQILAPIWNTKNETAKRLRSRIETILNAAKARGLREGDNVAEWKGNLEFFLTRDKATPRQHHAALDWDRMPEFWEELTQYFSSASICLQLLILTATRTSEAIGARWEEFDIQNKIWTIPATRMKNKKEHRIPLTYTTLKLLKSIPKLGSPFLFPAVTNDNKTMSNMAMTMLIRRMNKARLESKKEGWIDKSYNRIITVHGFRSTFRDWASETSLYPSAVPEQALAHSISNAVEAAYRRKDMLSHRENLMKDWARFITNKTT